MSGSDSGSSNSSIVIIVVVILVALFFCYCRFVVVMVHRTSEQVQIAESPLNNNNTPRPCFTP